MSAKKEKVALPTWIWVVAILMCILLLVTIGYAVAGVIEFNTRSYCSVTLPAIFEHTGNLLGDERDATPCRFTLRLASVQEMERYALTVVEKKTHGHPKISQRFLKEVKSSDETYLLPNGDSLIVRPTAQGFVAGELLFYNRVGSLKRREVVSDCRQWRQYLHSDTVYEPVVDSESIKSPGLEIGRYTVYVIKSGRIVSVIDWWDQQMYTGNQQGVLLKLDPYPVLCKDASLHDIEFAREQQHKR
jgi:hypothetical protein